MFSMESLMNGVVVVLSKRSFHFVDTKGKLVCMICTICNTFSRIEIEGIEFATIMTDKTADRFIMNITDIAVADNLGNCKFFSCLFG